MANVAKGAAKRSLGEKGDAQRKTHSVREKKGDNLDLDREGYENEGCVGDGRWEGYQ